MITAQQGGEFAPLTYPESGDADVGALALANIVHSRSLGLPQIERVAPHGQTMVIVAGAPSVRGYADQIKVAHRRGHAVFAVNEAHDWLIAIGVPPDGLVLYEVEADPRLLFMNPHPSTTYYVCSHCHPQNFEALEDQRVKVWHCVNDWPGTETEISKFGDGAFMVGGGSTTMLRTLSIGLVLGYRKFDLYGADSSYEGKRSHGIGDGQPIDIQPEISVIASGSDGFKAFRTRPYLARQADEFRRWLKAFGAMAEVNVYGDGLLPYIHRSMRKPNGI